MNRNFNHFPKIQHNYFISIIFQKLTNHYFQIISTNLLFKKKLYQIYFWNNTPTENYLCLNYFQNKLYPAITSSLN